MADIFHEVDEMMKQERLERFWNENKVWIITAITILIVGAAAITLYKNWNTGVKQEQTETLIAMFEMEDYPANVTETAKDLRPGLRGIALLSAGRDEMAAQRPESALSFYKQAAADNAIPAEFRDMAILMQTRLDSELNTVAKLDRLSGIYGNDESPWRYHAYLEAALIEAHERNDYGAARQHLKQITEARDIAAQSLLQKAQSLHHVYTLKQAQNPAPDSATDETSATDATSANEQNQGDMDNAPAATPNDDKEGS